MIFDYTVETISYSLSGHYFEKGYRLSNSIILLPSERDELGNYYAGVGIAGMILRTATTYRPVYGSENELVAFARND